MWARRGRAGLGVLLLVVVGIGSGCESPPRGPQEPEREKQGPTGEPASTAEVAPAEPAPAAPAGRPPAEPAAPAAKRAAPPAPAPTAQPAEPELPEYITVLERFERDAPCDVQARTEPGNRLVIDTRNVRRLRIERRALPLVSERSIVLQLDAQGMQWLAESPVAEFERSINGAWSPVKTSRTARPAR